jgi:hypothetical protein
MPFLLSRPPDEVQAEVETGLHRLTMERGFSSPLLQQPEQARLQVAAPHETYTIQLSELRQGAGLDRAQPVGWRYLLLREGEVAGTVDVVRDERGAYHFAQVSTGPFVNATDEALRELRSNPYLRERQWRLRLLNVPALYAMHLWLGAETEDLLVPLLEFDGLRRSIPYPSAEVLQSMARRAREVPTSDQDDLRGG